MTCTVSSATDEDGYNPGENYVYDTLTYKWTAGGGSWKNGDTGQSVIWIAPPTPGSYTITCTISDAAVITPPETGNRDDDNVVLSVTVKVIGGDYTESTEELRWYCGASVPETYKAKLTAASGQPSGTTYSWTVVSGPAEVFTGQGTSECWVRATDGSSQQNDIAVKLTYSNGNCACDYTSETFTALEPTQMTGPQYTHVDISSLPGYENFSGYASEARYYVLDQFGYSMHDYPAGETFGTRDDDHDYPNNDWPSPQAEGDVFPYVFYDVMVVGDTDADQFSPRPQAPAYSSGTWSNTGLVFTIPQTFRVGSTDGLSGCAIESHTAAFYVDHGQHEGT